MLEDEKKLVDLAIAYGRERLNPATGFLHGEGAASAVIPFRDNFFFAAALLSTRGVEASVEAKALIEKVLNFQLPSLEFPRHMHDYPYARERLFSLSLLPIFVDFIQRYSVAIGGAIAGRLTETVHKLTRTYLEEHFESAPYPQQVLAAAAAVAAGRVCDDQALLALGEVKLRNAAEVGECESWFVPEHLTVLFGALQAAYPDLEGSIWKEPVLRAASRWDKNMQTYIGPGLLEYYEEGKPILSGFDCMMAVQTGSFSPQALKPSHGHLTTSLFRRWKGLSLSESEKEERGLVDGRHWAIRRSESWIYSAIEQSSGLTPFWKGRHAFRCVWGPTLNLVFQVPYWATASFEIREDGPFLLTTLEQEADVEEEVREVCFFINNDEKVEIKVDGKDSTTFTLNQEVQVAVGESRFSLCFNVVKGNGRFIGHVLPGSRFAERGSEKGCDKQIFLRTLERSAPCTIAVQVVLINS